MFVKNRAKAELLIFNAKSRLLPSITAVSVCDEVIQPEPSAKSIGVVFDSSMSMEKHITTVCK